jgi:hypothetical protein
MNMITAGQEGFASVRIDGGAGLQVWATDLIYIRWREGSAI